MHPSASKTMNCFAKKLLNFAVFWGASSVHAQRLLATAPANAVQLPQLPAAAPLTRLPTLRSGKSLAPAPGLEGHLGKNVTLLTYNASCTGFTPETRISGSGIWNGTGLFVGKGTFTSGANQKRQVFTLANATFEGNASEGCIGAGQFSITNPKSSIGGNGSATGEGTFHFPEGLMTGSGKFEGVDLFFTNGTGNLTASHGSLYGEGTAEGSLLICTGSGSMEGEGSFQGTGTFEGEGYYLATNPRDRATFAGSGLLTGDGSCQPGEVHALEHGDVGSPRIADIIEYGDFVFDATLAAQAYALEPYAKKGTSPEPVPGLARQPSVLPVPLLAPTLAAAPASINFPQPRPGTPVTRNG